jgi:TonB family protein
MLLHGGPLLVVLALLTALAGDASRLPEVVEPVAAVFDPSLLPPEGVDVLLEVQLDAEGRVTTARVIGSTEPVLDAAAVAAMRDFRFSPALDALGRPAPSTIQYRFQLRREEVVTVALRGAVLVAGERTPLAGALVVLLRGEERRTALTDAAGRFELGGLEAGAWAMTVEAPGCRADVVSVRVAAGQLTEVTLYAVQDRPWEATDIEVVDIVAERIPPEVTERPLRADEIRVLPGSGGDVVRAVQNLPGVARSPLGIGQLIIRGKAPEDARYTVDGMEVPIVFHFSGLTTVLSSDLLDEVVFLPGGWSVRYGRNLGGRVDLRTTSALPERSTGYASLDLFQLAAFGSFRVGERTALTFAGRRSYIDTVLTPLLSNDEQAFRAPRYWDGQLRVTHALQGGGRVDALLFGSDDRFITGPLDDEGAPEAALGLSTSFLTGRVGWRTASVDGWTNELSVQAGPEAQVFKLEGEDAAYERRWRVELREEVLRRAPNGDRLRVGLDVQAGSSSFRYDVSGFGPEEEGSTSVFAPALYIEPTWARGPATITAGLRADLLTYGGRYTTWSVDPRLSARVRAGSTTTLTASLGRYAQLPGPRFVLEEGDGTPDLKPPWALQASVGLVQRLPYDLSLELSLYYDSLFGLIVGREERFRFFTGPPPAGPFDTNPYANEGRGMACGTELLLRWQTERAAAWLSATFGRSFRAGRDDVREAFEYDQPFVINALGTGALPRGWRLGGRVRLSAGNPYTPVVQRVYTLDLRRYLPVYGEPGSARLPTFFALDLRVDKTWTFPKWAFSLYLDVQNVTNTRNLEVIGWSWDFARETGIKGLPILPIFGLRGEG